MNNVAAPSARQIGRWMWRAVKTLIVIAVVAGGVYWLRFAPVPVTTHRVEPGEIIAEVMGTGTLEAHFRSAVSPRIAGRVQEVLVDQGDSVKKGQVLVRLDDVDMKPQVEIARASVAVAQSALDRLQADLGRTQAILEQTTVEQQRAQELLPQNAISRSDADKITADWKIAQAGVTRAEAALVEARKQLLAAETNLAYREALLGDTQIVAPFDGLIVQRHRDPGDIVVPGSSVLELVSTQELWIAAWVDETEMSRVAADQPARVVFRSEPEHAYRGEVARLGRQTDRETREFTVDVFVLELPKNWAVGQRAEVYIETARQSAACVVPMQFVLWRDRQPGVLVEQRGFAEWHDVTLGLRGREVVEVATGLEPGATIMLPAKAKNADIAGRRVRTP